MEQELKDILVQLLEGQSRLEARLDGVDKRFDGIDTRLECMDERFDGIDTRLECMDQRFDSLESEVKKNTINIEGMEKKLDIILEVQKSHLEADERSKNELLKPLYEKIEIVETAVKHISSDINELKDKFEKVEKVTIQNTYDLTYLKSVR